MPPSSNPSTVRILPLRSLHRMESHNMALLDPKEIIEITTAFVTDDDGNAIVVKKSRRRVSFAQTQTIHLIPRDDDFDTPPEARTGPISSNVLKQPPRKSPRLLAKANTAAVQPVVSAKSPPSAIHVERTETEDIFSDMDTSESQGSCRVDGIGPERECLDALEADSIGPVHLWHISRDGEDDSIMNDDVTMDAATFSLHLSRVLDSSSDGGTFDGHEEELTRPVKKSTPYKLVDDRTGPVEESTPHKFVDEGPGRVEKSTPSNFFNDSDKEIEGMSFTQFCKPNWRMPTFDQHSSHTDGNTSDMSLSTQLPKVRWNEKEKPSPATSSSPISSPVPQRSLFQAVHEDKENLAPQKAESGGSASIFGIDAKGHSVKSLTVQRTPSSTLRKHDSALKRLQNRNDSASSPMKLSVKPPTHRPHPSMISEQDILQLKCERLTDVLQNGEKKVMATLFPSKCQSSSDLPCISCLDHQQENIVEDENCYTSELFERRQERYQNACARLSSMKGKLNLLQKKLEALVSIYDERFQSIQGALEMDTFIPKLEALVRTSSLRNSLLHQQQLMHIKWMQNAEGTSHTDFCLDGMYYQRHKHAKGCYLTEIKISRWLDFQGIEKAFPGMNAHLAFQYAMNEIQDISSVQVAKLRPVLQHTNWVMGSLVDLLKEVKYCSVQFQLSSKFFLAHDGELQLRFTLFGSSVELKVILVFGMNCIKGHMYPKDMRPIDIEVKYVDDASRLVQNINASIENIEPGFGRLKNICNSVRKLVDREENMYV